MKRAADASNLGVMTKAVLDAGLVNKAQLDEMKRWSPVIEADAEAVPPKTLEEAAALVSEALQSEGYVLLRETDLEIVRYYVATTTAGKLHIELESGECTDVDVTYGKTRLGEIIIAWRSESIKDALVNGATYLVEGDTHIFFRDVREVFFGGQKAFMVCIPSSVEHV